MDHLLSKVLTQLVMPLGLGGLLVLAGIWALAFRQRGIAAVLSLVGLGWIWLWSLPVVSDWVRLSLEARYPPAGVESLPTAGAILVLGGAMQGAAPAHPYPNLGAAADRVWHAARLYHAGKAPLIVASGGRLSWARDPDPEADAMVQFLTALGVPQESLVAERHSRTTFENARETRPLLAARGIDEVLLVTSALHMQRAEATLRAAGIRVIAAPTDHEVLTGFAPTLLDYLPDAGALEGSSRALKEYLGLWVYRLRGWAAD